MELATLKTRLMEASGPDRELDMEILEAMGAKCEAFDGGDGDLIFTWKWPDGSTANAEPTAGVDAALELVERKLPGKSWRLGQFKNPKGEVECWAALDGVAVSYKSSLPIAILTALVTALIVENEE